MHTSFFKNFLLAGHLGFLIIFLVFKWTGTDSYNKNPIVGFFEEVRAWPLVNVFNNDIFEFRELN